MPLLLLLLTVGVAGETYGRGFLEVLGYIDVAAATIGLTAFVVAFFAAAAADVAKQRA